MLYYRIIWASLFWLRATGHLCQSFHCFLNREGAEAKPHALPLGTVSNHLPEAQHCSALSAFPPETSHFTLTLSTSRPLDHCGKHHTASSLSKAYSERIQRELRSLRTERCEKQKGRKREAALIAFVAGTQRIPML